MKVILLAAGRSRRVKPIEDKNFLRFAGKTLIEHQLDTLTRAGLKDILIIAGAHNHEKLEKIAHSYKAKVLIQKNLEEGMAGAVLTAEPEVKGESILISSTNDVLGQSAFETLQKASTSSAAAYLLAYEVKEYFPGGYLCLDGKRITSITEKPGAGNEPSAVVNVVAHLFKAPESLFAALHEGRSEKDDCYEAVLNTLMQKEVFEAVPYSGFWQAIKFPWHILDLMEFSFKMMGERVHPSAEIAETAVIKGPVVIEEGVKIFDHAVIQGPAYIGKNSIVGNNVLVRDSMLGERCVVGYSTEVARSFIGDDCWFHSNYIGDTVMGDDCSFGAGAVCANLRLDEKEIHSGGIPSGRNKLGPVLGSHIRIGVQTSLMPGVRIGSNTMITSGLVLAQDISENQFASGEISLKIKNNRANLDKSQREGMRNKL